MNKTILASAFTIAFAISANANTIITGTLTAGGTPSTPDQFTVQGQVLASMGGALPPPTVGLSTFTGTYEVAVVADENNVYGDGDLDFLYQIYDTGTGTKPGSQGIIENSTGNAFNVPGAMVDAGYDTGFVPVGTTAGTAPGFSSGGIVPGTDQLSTGGATVQFNFNSPNTPLTVGTHSVILVVETNLTQYDAFGLVSAIDGSTSTAFAYEPNTGTPEPGTLLLLGAGLCGLGVIRRKRISAI